MKRYTMRFSLTSFLFFYLSVFTGAVKATDLVDVYPITDEIICLYFDDGHIDYYGYGHDGPDRWPNIKFYNSPLNVTAAKNTSNFTLTGQDGNYNSGKNPVYIGHKAKAFDYYQLDDWGNVSYDDQWVKEHWLYVQLPDPLQRGVSYTIDIGTLATNLQEFTFVYDEAKMRSEAIHVNQIGYKANEVKYGYLSQWMGDFNNGSHQNGGLELDGLSGTKFHIVPVDNPSISASVFEGTISKRKDKSTSESSSGNYGTTKNFTFADVWECDFTAFNTPGEYLLVVERMGCSYPFHVGNDAFRDAYFAASRAMFYQRTGIEKEINPEQGLVWPRDHHPDDVLHWYDAGVSEGTKMVHSSKDGPRIYDVWGYYHDAGDWDRIWKHDQIPLMFLLLYDLVPENFADGDISNRYRLNDANRTWFNEGQNGIPDILDEARWTLEFYKRGRHAAQAQGFGTGGCVGSYMGREGANDGWPSWEDDRNWCVSAEGVNTTYKYVGMAAWYAALLKEDGYPSSEYQPWIDEALDAYSWAQNKGGGDNENKALAAVGLYRATGNTSYQNTFKNTFNDGWVSVSTTNTWENTAGAYACIPDDFPGLDKSFRDGNFKNDILSKADQLVDPVSSRGFRFAVSQGRDFQLGSHSTPRTHLIAVAYELSGNSKYKDAIFTTASYTLGGNEMNLCFMTRTGENPERVVFLKDAWNTVEWDYNSMVYSNPYPEGYTSYGGHIIDWVGGMNEEWSHESAVPNWGSWPKGEGRFQNRYSISGSEFTVHQQNCHNVFTYGYCCGNSSGQSSWNPQPTISINLSNGTEISKNGTTQLTATASNDTREVHYYFDWHFLGKSKDKSNNFAYNWDVSQSAVNIGTEYLITAVAYDDKGLISEPSTGGDAMVMIVDQVVPTPPDANAGADVVITLPDNSATLNGSASFDEGLITGYTWSQVSGPSTATIQDNKAAVTQVSGLIEGTYEFSLEVTDNDSETDMDNVFVYVSPYTAVEGITIDNCPGTMASGSAHDLTITFIPVDATNRNVSWSTSDESVLTVTNGSIQAVGPGTATITVTTSEGSFTDQCEIFVSGPAADYNVPKTSALITVDGQLNEADWDISTSVSKDISGSSDNTVQFGLLWDDTYLYVGVYVQDANLTMDSDPTKPWKDDAVEVYIDGGFEQLSVYDANDRQIVQGYNNNSLSTSSPVAGIEGAWAAASGGYNAEFAIPWAGLGVTAAAGKYLGFDVGVDDDDDGGEREAQLMWKGTGDNWKNPSNFGITKLNDGSGPVTYTLSITSNNGSVTTSPDKTQYDDGESVTLTAIPATGYEFTSWSGAASGSTNPVTIVMDNNKSVTANFTQIQKHTITTSATNGTVVLSPSKTEYDDGEVVSVTAFPDNGYQFTGWSGNLSGTTNPATVTMNSDKSITANFSAIQTYTITTTASNGTVVLNPNKTEYEEGEMVSVTALPDNGYKFDGWSGDLGGTANPTSITMNSDKSIMAAFSTTTDYVLNVFSDHGTITKSPDKSSYLPGETVTLTVTPASGYNFVEWTGDASGTSTSVTITMDNNKLVNANYEQITYTLSINATNGSVSLNPQKTNYASGETVFLTASADAGYEFASWSGDASGTNSVVSIVMDGNKNVTANFTQLVKYTITINSSNGVVSKIPNKTEYDENEVVVLTAEPGQGYTFDSWSGDAAGTNASVTITMDGNKNVTANYTEVLTYTISATASNGSIVVSPNKDSYSAGEDVILTALADAGYVFENWSGDLSGSDNPIIVTMDGDKTIEAIFSKEPTSIGENGAVNLLVYPVPCTDVVTIRAAINLSRYEIVNTLGQTLVSGEVDEKLVKVDVSALPDGLYFARIGLSNEDVETRRMIKK